jgi:hypothetical protein
MRLPHFLRRHPDDSHCDVHGFVLGTQDDGCRKCESDDLGTEVASTHRAERLAQQMDVEAHLLDLAAETDSDAASAGRAAAQARAMAALYRRSGSVIAMESADEAGHDPPDLVLQVHEDTDDLVDVAEW